MSLIAATDLLAIVRAAGGDLLAVGDRLRVTAPEPLPAELVERLRAAKPELLAMLSSAVAAPRTNEHDERAAIAEPEGVPFMITQAMRRDLDTRGYSADDIRGMSPAKAREILQPGTAAYPADTWGDDQEERAAIVKEGTGCPPAWAEGFARLDATRPPGDVPSSRWRTFIDDAGRFIDLWAQRAIDLGWQPLQLFGCDRIKPFARIDHAGLLWLLDGRKLIALTADTAMIEAAPGVRQTYRRMPTNPGNIALPWQLDGRKAGGQ